MRTEIQRLVFFALITQAAWSQAGTVRSQMTLSREGAAEPADAWSGRWNGTLRSGGASKPVYLTLRFFKPNGALNGSMGPDAGHQLPIRNGNVTDGVARFTVDMLSDVSLSIQDGHLVGESVRVPDVRSNVRLHGETAGFDNVVQELIATFDQADILALGESHRRKMDSDLRIALVRHPEFTKKARLVVVEFGNTASQAVLDRYIAGEDVAIEDLQQVWGNSPAWESPVYAQFFAAVRDVNRMLPSNRKIRVLAGDPPPGGDERLEARDLSAASILEAQVLGKHEKALLLYGSAHTDRVGGITKAVQAKYPGRMFVVHILGGPFPEYEKFERAVRAAERPVLIAVTRTPFRDFNAQEFLGRGSILRLGGVEVPMYPPNLTLGQMADACVYLGNSAEVETRVRPAGTPSRN